MVEEFSYKNCIILLALGNYLKITLRGAAVQENMKDMYRNKFVVVVIVDGKIQQETASGTCEIPFGSQYTIRLRNRNSKRAVCNLYIDGENVSGGGFIIEANSHVDIERPVHSNRKFLFDSIDSENAYDQGKNAHFENYNHGLIEAKFALERVYQPYYTPNSYTLNSGLNNPNLLVTGAINSNHLHDAQPPISGTIKYGSDCFSSKSLLRSNNMQITSTSANFAGVTLEGDKSNQTFTTTNFVDDGDWTTVRLRLRGVHETVKDSDTKLKELELELAKLQKIKELEAQIQALKNS